MDFPLGHTSGRPGDQQGQRRLVRDALAAFEAITEPGTIVDLGEAWGDDAWRADPMGNADGDSRSERHATPQYQSDDDARRAAERLGEDVACQACAVFDA